MRPTKLCTGRSAKDEIVSSAIEQSRQGQRMRRSSRGSPFGGGPHGLCRGDPGRFSIGPAVLERWRGMAKKLGYAISKYCGSTPPNRSLATMTFANDERLRSGSSPARFFHKRGLVTKCRLNQSERVCSYKQRFLTAARPFPFCSGFVSLRGLTGLLLIHPHQPASRARQLR
jgi:hypothetical protein